MYSIAEFVQYIEREDCTDDIIFFFFKKKPRIRPLNVDELNWKKCFLEPLTVIHNAYMQNITLYNPFDFRNVKMKWLPKIQSYHQF